MISDQSLQAGHAVTVLLLVAEKRLHLVVEATFADTTFCCRLRMTLSPQTSTFSPSIRFANKDRTLQTTMTRKDGKTWDAARGPERGGTYGRPDVARKRWTGEDHERPERGGDPENLAARKRRTT